MGVFTSVNPTDPYGPNNPNFSNPVAGSEDGVAATVVQGNIPITGNNALYQNQGKPGSIWNEYRIVSRYERDTHRFMLPIASPTPFNGRKASIVQLANPTLIWIVSWTVTKTDDVPQIPSPTPINNNWVLMDDCYELQDLRLMIDGQSYVYSVSGVYVYACTNPDDQMAYNIRFPVPPWSVLGQNVNTIDPSYFTPGYF